MGADKLLRFDGTNANLDAVLQLLGLRYADVADLPNAQFRQLFASLNAKQPGCRYKLRFLESTRYVDARDAARLAFFLDIERL